MQPAFAKSMSTLLGLLVKSTNDQQNDIKQTAVKAIKQFAKKYPQATSDHLELLVPPLFQRARDRASVSVKLGTWL